MTTTNAAKASEVRLLRAVSKALKPFDTDLADLEKRAETHDQRLQEHEKADNARFMQAQQGIAELHHEVAFMKNHLELIHDQMLDGFRNLGAQITKRDPNEVTPPVRRGRNGQ